MKKTILISALMLSVPAFAAVDPAVMAQARETTSKMSDDQFCRTLGISSYTMEGTPQGSIQRLTNEALTDLRYERMRKWSNKQKDNCTALEMQAYKVELCSVEECD